MDLTVDNEELLAKFLGNFSCEEDSDIESFLHKRAILFEETAKARTYLICDQEELYKDNLVLNELVIYGYISIALNVLTVSDTVSNRLRKELDGFNAKKKGKQLESFPCYLIGQLSRNSCVPKGCITGDELIEYANYIIQTAVQRVGGRYMMIECQDDEHLKEFYQKNNFVEFGESVYNDDNIVQMIRRLQ